MSTLRRWGRGGGVQRGKVEERGETSRALRLLILSANVFHGPSRDGGYQVNDNSWRSSLGYILYSDHIVHSAWPLLIWSYVLGAIRANGTLLQSVWSIAKRFFNASYAGFLQPHCLLLHHHLLRLLFMPQHGLTSLFYYLYTISHPTIFVTAKRHFMSGGYSTTFYTGRLGPEVQIFTLLRRVPLFYNFQWQMASLSDT